MTTLKKLFIWTVIAAMLVLNACSTEQPNESSEVSVLSESPAEDFEYTESESTVVINEYYSADETVVIPKEINGKTVAAILSSAFLNNDKVVNVIIPETVTYIGPRAFAYCDMLKSVVLPQGLQAIEASTFEDCVSLESISLPEGLTKIDSYAFKNCKSLKSIKIHGEKLESWGTEVFYGSGLENVEFGEGITYIPYAGFTNSNIKEVILPNSVTDIGGMAFAQCPIEKIQLNEGLTRIDGYAFSGKATVSEITVPASVTVLDETAFEDIASLESVTFMGNAPEGFTDAWNAPSKLFTIYYNEGAEGFSFPRWNGYPTRIIGSDAEPMVYEDFEYIENKGGITITAYLGEKTEAVIPSQIGGKDVTVIGNSAFKQKSIRSVTMPDTVVSIEAMAFHYCSKLKNITFSKNLKTIGDIAFAGCSAVEEFIIPEGVVSIGAEAFRFCEMKAITLPESITEIGYAAFANCEGITQLTLPTGLTEISDALCFASTLESIDLHEGIVTIGADAFGSTNITDIVLPSTVKSVGNAAFHCELKTAVLNDGLESIGETAFAGSALTELVIPASVNTVHVNIIDGSSPLFEALKFEGDAPEIFTPEDTYIYSTEYTVYYHEGAEGFGDNWNDRPTEIW